MSTLKPENKATPETWFDLALRLARNGESDVIRLARASRHDQEVRSYVVDSAVSGIRAGNQKCR